jgi:hypothetical protein
MVRSVDLQQERIQEKIKEVAGEFGGKIYAILQELNQTRLKGNGQLNEEPYADEHSLRWMMKWKEAQIAYELSVVIRFEDTGREAHIGGVWVRRHASTPLDFDGHTPTTRMRRVTNFSIKDIRDAIEAEWG